MSLSQILDGQIEFRAKALLPIEPNPMSTYEEWKEQEDKEFRERFDFMYAPDFSWEKLEEKPYVLASAIEAYLSERDKRNEKRVVEENGNYKEIAEKLWDILDSIDSLPDMIHPKTPKGHENCWRGMVKRAEERHKLLKTDGYTLSLP